MRPSVSFLWMVLLRQNKMVKGMRVTKIRCSQRTYTWTVDRLVKNTRLVNKR